MVKFAVYAKIKADKLAEFRAALREFLPAVAAEPKTLQYDICQAESDPTSVLFFEAYPDEAGQKAHTESEAFKAYMAKIRPYLESPPQMMKLIESAKE